MRGRRGLDRFLQMKNQAKPKVGITVCRMSVVTVQKNNAWRGYGKFEISSRPSVVTAHKSQAMRLFALLADVRILVIIEKNHHVLRFVCACHGILFGER